MTAMNNDNKLLLYQIFKTSEWEATLLALIR